MGHISVAETKKRSVTLREYGYRHKSKSSRSDQFAEYVAAVSNTRNVCDWELRGDML